MTPAPGTFEIVRRGSLIPQHVERSDAQVVAGDDLLVLYYEDRIELRFVDPNQTGVMMYISDGTFMEGQGGGVHLLTPSRLRTSIDGLRLELERVVSGRHSRRTLVSHARTALDRYGPEPRIPVPVGGFSLAEYKP